MSFSERLKELRKSKKINQTILANAVNLNIKQIQRYEGGSNEPTLSVLIALADFFDVSLDYLVGRSDVAERR
ncbi:MAG: helix-turn-helix domain-containing protein [Candidatus Pararuminococcus gallinarum]|jgi:transcriptional regulator with XRE-family HTH domain